MAEKRRFSRSERMALYLAADGKCQNCGKPLDASFHADHIHPYSKDGATDVLNGQALCDECNLKKGARMPIKYRTWQDEQFAFFVQHLTKWFTLVVTPGGGKTVAMLRSAKFSMDTGETNFLIIVVPSETLKTQWKIAARLFDLHLVSAFTGYVTEDFDGCIVTYQQLSGSVGRDAVRAQHNGRKTFVILDEPHHMADGKSWGKNAEYALTPSVRGILGTGTPFRTDEYRIPFAEYDPNTGELKTHYEYNYDDALIDQVVRALFFRKIGAQTTWYSYTDEIITASFYDEVDKRQVSERLNATIDARSEYVKNVLKQAYAETMHLRKTEQPNAGMLVIGRDTTHIGMLAEVYEQITGDKPLIVSSDEDHGDKSDIEAFKKDDRIAVFAVNMISEGVDIPRLRSLVYLTNVTAPLYFYQAIGRVARVEPGRELLNGYVYLPSDPRLLELAHKVKERRVHVLDAFPRTCPRCNQNPCVCEKTAGVCPHCHQKPCICWKPPSLFESISSIPVYEGGVYGGEGYSEAELKAADEWIKANGYRIPLEEGAKILRKISISPVQVIAPLPVVENDPEEMKISRGKTANRRAYRLAQVRGVSVESIHKEWVYKHNGHWQNEATIADLERKIKWLNHEISRGV